MPPLKIYCSGSFAVDCGSKYFMLVHFFFFLKEIHSTLIMFHSQCLAVLSAGVIMWAWQFKFQMFVQMQSNYSVAWLKMTMKQRSSFSYSFIFSECIIFVFVKIIYWSFTKITIQKYAFSTRHFFDTR